MKSIDLTHLISETMPVYPGTEPPCMDTGTTLEKDGFLEKKITFIPTPAPTWMPRLT